jgi:hypothetical protein
MPLAVRSPVSDAVCEIGSGCEENGYLLLAQLLLLHRGGKHDLRELVSPSRSSPPTLFAASSSSSISAAARARRSSSRPGML